MIFQRWYEEERLHNCRSKDLPITSSITVEPTRCKTVRVARTVRTEDNHVAVNRSEWRDMGSVRTSNSAGTDMSYCSVPYAPRSVSLSVKWKIILFLSLHALLPFMNLDISACTYLSVVVYLAHKPLHGSWWKLSKNKTYIFILQTWKYKVNFDFWNGGS